MMAQCFRRTKEEWQSMFLPLSEQRKLRNRREGMDIQPKR